MKKLGLIVMSALLICSAAWAEDGFSVNPPTIPQGGTGEVEIVFESATSIYNRFQLEVQMPEGITCIVQDKAVECAKGSLIASTDHVIASSHIVSQDLERFVCYSPNNVPIPAGSGVIMTVTYQADGSLPVGSTHKGYIKNILWNDADNNEYRMDDIEFTVTIGDNRVVLNENSTTPPADAEGVNVRVKRTISAGSWNTICLPFAMTEAQCKAAFGNDVELADFTHCEATYDDNEDVTGLEVEFQDVDIAGGMEANHPYIIKVSEAITEFTADGVDIEVEEAPSVDRDEYKVKPKVFIYNSFVGTYVAQTAVPEECLFLSGNKFWYSTGVTQMKAFRAYFDFYDVLSDPEDSGARVAISIDDAPTGIVSVRRSEKHDNVYYDLSGRRVERPGKGFYIVNGKKILK